MSTALIVLAAGKGTRMKSDLPKVLHPLASAPLLHHALQSGAALSPEKTIIVTGHGKESVQASAYSYQPNAICVEQAEQLGTGHAVLCAEKALSDFSGDVCILYGDTPFIRAETLEQMAGTRRNGADLVILGFEPEDPAKYGRLIVEGDRLKRIVEFKDASDAERKINLCNSGVVLGDATTIFKNLNKIEPSKVTGEIYLTDLAEALEIIIPEYGTYCWVP